MLKDNDLFSSLNKVGAGEKSVIDITGDFDFSLLTLYSAPRIDKFWYFYNKANFCYGDTFILEDKTQVQIRCRLTLIQESEKLVPRFCFFIWNKITKEKVGKVAVDSDIPHSIKSLVNLESGEANRNFWKLINFLLSIKELSLDRSNSYEIIKSDDEIVEILKSKDKESILNILSSLSKEQKININDINIILDRKRTVEIFEKLLNDKDYWKIYASENEIKDLKEEKVWQYFLSQNDWIFGYGLDYRFMTIFDREASVGDADISNMDKPQVDFLNTYSDFTVLVEIKLPNTEIFDSSRQRAGAWKLSDSFIDSISQCLEQKAEWQIKSERGNQISKDGKNILYQRTRDPKIVLLVGNKNEQISNIQDIREKNLKQDTFELYRRDSRNVEIVTYDELFERASFLVRSHNVE